MVDVFVYYAQTDKDFVKRLIDELRQKGVDANGAQGLISPGTDWSPQLKEIKKKADALLYVLDQQMLQQDLWQFLFNDPQKVFFCTKHQTPVRFTKVYIAGEERAEEYPVINFSDSFDAALQRLIDALPESVRQDSPLEPAKIISKGYVFISYSNRDADFVNRLRVFLDAKGYGFWDYKKSDREYHSPFHLELEEAIYGASAVLAVVSPEWKHSLWAAKEYLFSEQIDKAIFVLKYRDAGPTLLICDRTYIDCETNEKNGLKELDRALRRKGLID